MNLRELQTRFPNAQLLRHESEIERLVAKVISLLETPSIGLDLPLDIRGTAFQQRVWQVLRAIPVGSTASYSQIARRIGQPKSMRSGDALRCKSVGGRHPLPPRRACGWIAGGLPLGNRAKAAIARARERSTVIFVRGGCGDRAVSAKKRAAAIGFSGARR